MDVGTRLRSLREQRGLSQRDLAHKAGLSSATISMIENARISPTVGTLRRIVESMGLTIAEFFSPAPSVTNPVFFPADQLVEIGTDDISYRQVGANLRDKPLQILHELYAPGADTGRNSLQHRGFEGGIIISGRLEVTVGRQKRILGPGDAYFFNSSVPHRFRNPGPGPCRIVSACSPPSF
jgi:transcriptional regulator with XRE-family HTH domain